MACYHAHSFTRRNRLLGLLLALCLLFPFNSFSSEIYAILIGDTEADNIGSSVATDIVNMSSMIDQVAKEIDLPVKKTLLTGKQVVSTKISGLIRKLPITSEDLVVLYFSGHGFRTYAKKGLLPYIYLAVERVGEDIDSINKVILSRNPRFFLAFIDSCNNYPWTPIAKQSLPTKPYGTTTLGYRQLFLHHRGSLLIASAQPGEFSWCTPPKGSFASRSFLEALAVEVKKGKQADWHSLLLFCSTGILKKGVHQHMTYDYQLKVTP